MQGNASIMPLAYSESKILGKILLEKVHKNNERLKVNSLERCKAIHHSSVLSLKQHIKGSREIPQEVLSMNSGKILSFANP